MADPQPSATPQPGGEAGANDPPQPRKKLANPLLLIAASAVFAVASMLAAALAVTNVHDAAFESEQAETMALYLACIPSILLGLLSVVCLVGGAVRWAVHGHDGRGIDLTEANREVVQALDLISHRLLLSETAKKVAYRGEDLKALREAIRKDIDTEQYDAALVLLQEMATTYGFKEEAEKFREEVLAARAAGREARVSRALTRLDEILARHDFEAATEEAGKIQRLFPESERVRMLDRKVGQAREQYKHDLERKFLEAAQKGDIDAAMTLLEEMDKYLTEQEAEPFRETARGVIGKKRDNLGVQFKLAVQDKEWSRAVRVGEQIIRDFPNSRMADEVRGMLDLLRERAAGQQAATA